MADTRRTAALAAVLTILLVACGGGGASSPGAPAGASADAGQSQVAPEPAPSDAVPTTEPPSGGGAAGDVCALVTADELGGILGQPVNLTVLPGPPDTCDVQSTDGAPLAAFVLTNMGGPTAATVYEAYASDPGSTDVSGIGEKAAYNPNQAALVILKNGAVLTVAVFDDGTADEAARLELMKQIGSTAAGRM